MRILVVSDGRRGIENQALGLAEAIARIEGPSCVIATHVVRHGPVFSALPPNLQLALPGKLTLPDADLVIGCGRQAVAPLIHLRRKGARTFTTYVQHPRTEPSRFDLVVAPEHDGLDNGPFVETMIGSPNRVTRDRIIAETLAHRARLAALPMPRAMIAIGGPSKSHDMSEAERSAHLSAAQDLISAGYSLLVTTSRRTPDDAQAAWENFARDRDDVWLNTPESDEENPYFAFLGGADLILVTEDSTNMLTEGCATGKPVFRLPMKGDPGKFARLYDALEKRCGVRRWDGQTTSENYEPLRETERIARVLLERFKTAQSQPSSS